MRSMCSLRLLAAWSLINVAVAQNLCYWPNGTETTDQSTRFTPCYAGTDGHCCAYDEMCLDNGLCFGANIGAVSRMDYA